MEKKATEEVKAIVRCRRCTYWRYHTKKEYNAGFGHCIAINMMTDKNWWCANGKENANEK